MGRPTTDWVGIQGELEALLEAPHAEVDELQGYLDYAKQRVASLAIRQDV